MADQAPDPFVIAVAFDLPLSDGFADALREIVPGTELVVVPYAESAELRNSRARHGGRNGERLETPLIDDAARADWSRAHVAIVLDLPDDIATLAPQLRWIQSANAGVDTYDLGSLAAAGVQLTNASGLGAASIAEFVMARLLQVWKHLATFDANQRQHEWSGQFGTELTGRTLGIAGLGSIGRQVARRARAFDMRVVATRASARAGDTDPDLDELFAAADLDAMLGRCDAVVACVPSNASTLDLFDAGRFAAIRDGAIFCNVGRGAQVVESDLIAALESGHLRAAALDVTRIEPLPADDPLWDAPNLYLSPHSSVSLDRYTANLERLVVENLRRLVDGADLVNDIDLSER